MKNWSSKSVGSKFQQNIFYFLIKFFGYLPAYILLYPVILWYSTVPYTRKRAAHYLKRRFSDYGLSPVKTFLHTYRLYLNFGKVLLDRAIMGITGQFNTQYSKSDIDRLNEILSEEKGAIILMAHTGFGETNMNILKNIEKKTHVVLYFDEKDVDRHYFEYSTNLQPFNIINSNAYLGAALEIMAALEKNEIVCMMGDRPLGNASAAVEFLGSKANFLISPFKFAAAMDTKIVICFSVRTGICRSEIYIADIINYQRKRNKKYKPDDFINHVRRFSLLLEDFVSKYPYQFFNFYNMWVEDN